MSHIVKTESCLKRRDLLEQACKELGITILGEGTHEVESYGTSATGFGISLGHAVCVIDNDGHIQYGAYNKPGKQLVELKKKYNTLLMKEVLARKSRMGKTKFSMQEKRKNNKTYIEIDVS